MIIVIGSGTVVGVSVVWRLKRRDFHCIRRSSQNRKCFQWIGESERVNAGFDLSDVIRINWFSQLPKSCNQTVKRCQSFDKSLNFWKETDENY
jgi:hypothetical protein